MSSEKPLYSPEKSEPTSQRPLMTSEQPVSSSSEGPLMAAERPLAPGEQPVVSPKEPASETVGEKIGMACEGGRESLENAAGYVAEKAGELKEGTKVQAIRLGEMSKEAAIEVKEAIATAAHDSKEYLAGKAAGAKEATAEACEAAKEKTEYVGENVKTGFYKGAAETYLSSDKKWLERTSSFCQPKLASSSWLYSVYNLIWFDLIRFDSTHILGSKRIVLLE